jgi:hypothetical protein
MDEHSRILYPKWQHEYQAAIVELNHKTFRHESWQQRRQYSTASSPFRKALTIKLNGRLSRML